MFADDSPRALYCGTLALANRKEEAGHSIAYTYSIILCGLGGFEGRSFRAGSRRHASRASGQNMAFATWATKAGSAVADIVNVACAVLPTIPATAHPPYHRRAYRNASPAILLHPVPTPAYCIPPAAAASAALACLPPRAIVTTSASLLPSLPPSSSTPATHYYTHPPTYRRSLRMNDAHSGGLFTIRRQSSSLDAVDANRCVRRGDVLRNGG